MLVIRVCVARLIVLFESIDNGENCISFSYILLLSSYQSNNNCMLCILPVIYVLLCSITLDMLGFSARKNHLK